MIPGVVQAAAAASWSSGLIGKLGHRLSCWCVLRRASSRPWLGHVLNVVCIRLWSHEHAHLASSTLPAAASRSQSHEHSMRWCLFSPLAMPAMSAATSVSTSSSSRAFLVALLLLSSSKSRSLSKLVWPTSASHSCDAIAAAFCETRANIWSLTEGKFPIPIPPFVFLCSRSAEASSRSS